MLLPRVSFPSLPLYAVHKLVKLYMNLFFFQKKKLVDQVDAADLTAATTEQVKGVLWRNKERRRRMRG